MKELFEILNEWTSREKPFAIATVIQTWGSSPRPVGSTMLISNQMEMSGSVSGGCVEGAVIKSALPLIDQGHGQRLAYGVADEDAWSVGLSCGGSMQVYVERFLAFDDRPAEKSAWGMLQNCLQHNRSCVLLTKLVDGQGAHTVVLPDGEVAGTPVSSSLRDEALRAFQERKSQVVAEVDQPYFAQVFPRKSQMLIIGAAHITADLVKLATQFDFETVVIDPRGVFARNTTFSHAPDQLYEKYPSEVLPDFTLDAYTYAVILSHDPKIDDNALHILLRSGVGYIGALGSKKTHAKRIARLQKAGFTDEEIGRIHAPIGVDIHAKTPAEIALSVMGEIISVKNAFQ